MRDATHYGRDGAASCPAKFWSSPTPFDPGAPTSGDPLPAFVNEDRWIVACPTCCDAQLASLDDPRFMCVTCANKANDGHWLPVEFPKALPGIVAALDVRADAVLKNWVPGESVEDLVAQNTLILEEDTR